MDVALSMLCTVVDTVDFGGAADAKIRYDDHNIVNERLNATSSPPVTEVYCETLTGTQTLDLTSLTRTERDDLDATGLKLQILRVINLSTTNTVAVGDGAASAYQINGGNDVDIPIGGRIFHTYNDQLADVAAGVKNLKFTATGGEQYRVLLVFG